MDFVKEVRVRSRFIISKTGAPALEDRAAEEIERLRHMKSGRLTSPPPRKWMAWADGDGETPS